MPNVLTSFNWGSSLYNENPSLTRQLDQAYTQTAFAVNTKSSKYVDIIDPPNAATENQVNRTLDLGDFWVNKVTDNAWIMTSRTTDLLVTWTQIT